MKAFNTFVVCILLTGCTKPKMAPEYAKTPPNGACATVHVNKSALMAVGTSTSMPPDMAPSKPRPDLDNYDLLLLVQEQRRLLTLYKTQVETLNARIDALQKELVKTKAK